MPPFMPNCFFSRLHIWLLSPFLIFHCQSNFESFANDVAACSSDAYKVYYDQANILTFFCHFIFASCETGYSV